MEKPELSQYFTPLWAAEALVDRHFPYLSTNDFVLEPACGKGAFLSAIPSHVPALGVEIDSWAAAIARRDTGREIIVGDFLAVELDVKPTVIIGNPPFNTQIIDGFFNRAHHLLVDGGQMGMLLPAYVFQTASRVAAYSDNWSIASEMIPRNIFPKLQLPLVFAVFTKDRRRQLVGLSLYLETDDVKRLRRAYRRAMESREGSVWHAVCKIALESLGGRATLQEIYQELEGNRPSRTQFWREQIRKTLRAYKNTFHPVETGTYQLLEAA